MFGFSLTKLLFTAVAIFVVWNGFKWYNRMQENRAVGGSNSPRRAEQKPSAHTPASGQSAPDAEEMVKCPVCETYVSSGSAVSCGKDGCPYPG
ncbi:MAG: hypothetical protein HN719_02560 [Alphaproteobacteria bacterium]|jgi:hypothetical protein|nr:hypothetical protein [Alphaproteobacteria bacterium]